MSIEKAAAIEMLGNDLDLIQNCIRLGWTDFEEGYTPEQKMKLTPRTRANTLADLIVYRARSAFDGHLRAECMDINQMFVVAFNCGIAVRFKKLDDSFVASNQPTRQAMMFAQQGVLPGISEGVNLNAGYRLDPLATKLQGIYLACPRGQASNHWLYNFNENGGEESGRNITLPLFPMGPDPVTKLAEKPFKIVRRGGEEKDGTDKS